MKLFNKLKSLDLGTFRDNSIQQIKNYSNTVKELCHDTSDYIGDKYSEYHDKLDVIKDKAVEVASDLTDDAGDILEDLYDKSVDKVHEIGSVVSPIGEVVCGVIKNIVLKVKEFITLPFLKARTKIEVPEAFKIQILEAEKNAVDVGIFNKNDDLVACTRYESVLGVDPTIRPSKLKYNIVEW